MGVGELNPYILEIFNECRCLTGAGELKLLSKIFNELGWEN